VLPLAESCMNSPIWILSALYILPPGFTLSIAKIHQRLAWTGLTCRPSWSPAPCRVARYLATTSNHRAYLLRLETAGLAILPSIATSVSADSLCWKFNSSLLADPGSASRRFHLHRFVSQALELALEAQDHTAVEARARLRTLDAAVSTGIAIRTHAPLLAEEESGVFTNKLKAVEVPPLASVQTGPRMDRFSLHRQMWKEKSPHILRPISRRACSLC
jgi:hypothetical protein